LELLEKPLDALDMGSMVVRKLDKVIDVRSSTDIPEERRTH